MNTTALLDGQAAVPEQDIEFTTRGRTITETDLTSFSALTGDWHPQHSDAEWASRSRFSGRVAHGMLVLSYAIGLVPFDPERVLALRGLGSATFKRPVMIGDTIRVRCRVESTRPLDDETALVTLGFRIVNQDDRTVALARVEAVCRQGAPSQADAPGYWPEESQQICGGEAFL